MIRGFNDDRDWFFKERFGMFVHWGLYSLPAWHEQILWRGDMSRKDYEKLMEKFNPTEFDPNLWLDLMETAGMDYICLTTKHHDGFCLWDTQYTDYNVMNTPYGKDIVGMLAEACQKRGVKLGLYYSIPDWNHTNYPNDGRHHEMFGPRPGDDPNYEKYIEYMKNQMRELCTNYGKLYQIFWDVNVLEWYEPEVNKMVRSLQPQAVINDRGPDEGDFSTPERYIPKGREFSRPTEGVSSLGRESWGYKKDEDYYSYKYLKKSIDKILAMGGNYMLNIGPMPDGAVTDKDVAALKSVGKWYKNIKEAFIDTRPAPTIVEKDMMVKSYSGETIERDDFLVTKKDNTLYIHLYQDPQSTAIILKPLDTLPKKATLLNNGEELEARVDVTPWHWQEKPYLRIRGIPVNEFNDTVMVIKLEFDDSINE